MDMVRLYSPQFSPHMALLFLECEKKSEVHKYKYTLFSPYELILF